MGTSGKGAQPSPPPVMGPEQDSSELMLMQMQMMQQAMAQSAMAAAAIPQAPPMAQVPEIYTSPTVDWSDKIKQISSRMKGEDAIENARRIGRAQTILSSPLLDEEEAVTTDSLLEGSVE